MGIRVDCSFLQYQESPISSARNVGHDVPPAEGSPVHQDVGSASTAPSLNGSTPEDVALHAKILRLQDEVNWLKGHDAIPHAQGLCGTPCATQGVYGHTGGGR